MNKIIKVYIFLILLLFSLSIFTALSSGKVSALTGSEFKANRIIDDSIFYNSNTMNTGDIQNFLNAKVPTCDTNGALPSNRAGYATRADWGRANGMPPPYTCLRNFSQSISSTSADAYCGAIAGGTKSAADIIFNVSRACGINPQSLLVLIQKESAGPLITDDWPWAIQYRSATGYGCPDTAACDSTYYGFFNQVYNAGRQLKRYVQLPQSFNYAVGRTSFIAYQANRPDCSGTNVSIQTSATAALYNYTPYQPNAAALANLYGTGNECSAYGNRNFWRIFNDWFGSTKADSFSIALDESTNSQYLLFGGLKQAILDPEVKIAWGIQDYPLVSMPSDLLATIPSGPNLDRLTRLNTSDNTVFFMDGGKRYRVMSQQMYDAWNFTGRPITNVPPALFYIPADGGELTYTVKNPNDATLYTVDGRNNSSLTVLRPFASSTVHKAWEGDFASYTSVSSNYFGQINDAIGTTLASTKINYNGNEFQVVNGSRLSMPSPYSQIYPSDAQDVSLATYSRLVSRGSVSHLVRSANENTVYLIDNNSKRIVSNPSVLTAWTQPGGVVQLVNNNFLSLIPDGQLLNSYVSDSGGQLFIMNNGKNSISPSLLNAYSGLSTAAITTNLMQLYPQSSVDISGFIRGSNSPQVYFLDNSGNKRHIETPEIAELYGTYTEGIVVLPDSLVATIPQSTSTSLFVSDGTEEYIIEGGEKHSVDITAKSNWGLESPQTFTDGTLDRFSLGSTLPSKIKINNNYFLIREGKAFLTTDINIANAWGINNSIQMNNSLIKSLLSLHMLARFVNSSTDGRVFVVDNGEWYNLSSLQLINLGGANAPRTLLNPATAPSVISEWTNVVVKDGAGKHYVIDNGTKKDFKSPIIQNHWTNNGSLSVPTMTNGFLNLLPNNGKVERVIKGSGPAVYSAQYATKQHILSSSTYNQFYAPFERVSDALINVMPTGNNID